MLQRRSQRTVEVAEQARTLSHLGWIPVSTDMHGMQRYLELHDLGGCDEVPVLRFERVESLMFREAVQKVASVLQVKPMSLLPYAFCLFAVRGYRQQWKRTGTRIFNAREVGLE